jgi:hypothetical protein
MFERAQSIRHVISDQMRTVLSEKELGTLKQLLGKFVSAFNSRVRNPLIVDTAAPERKRPKDRM